MSVKMIKSNKNYLMPSEIYKRYFAYDSGLITHNLNLSSDYERIINKCAVNNQEYIRAEL